MLKKTSNCDVLSSLLAFISKLTFSAPRKQGLLKSIGFEKERLGFEFYLQLV